MRNKKTIEIAGNDNAIKIALKYKNYYNYAFLYEWNGEKYENLYKFNRKKLEFEKI